MSPKIHLLIPLPQNIKGNVYGITHRAACQRAYSLHTGRQLRGTLNPNEVTCDKCKGRQHAQEAKGQTNAGRFLVTYKVVTPKSRIFHSEGTVCIEAATDKDAAREAEKFLGGGLAEGIEIISAVRG